MTRNLEILNELVAISPAVANLSAEMPYQVPEGYFETLSEVIVARALAASGEETLVKSTAGLSMPFDVPSGYFENLSSSILEKIKIQEQTSATEELQNLSPLLASISKENVYTVPGGYFETLNAVDAVKASHKTTGKVVSMFQARTWVRMAAAAAILLMVAFGLNRIAGTKSDLDGYVKQGLNKYNTEAKLNAELQNINDSELVSYLQNTSSTADVATVSFILEETEANELAPVEDDALLESFMNQLDSAAETTTQTN